jgi:tyrosine-protein kinase Etk/Wzc
LTKSHKHRPVTEDIGFATLGRAVWRAKGWIAGLAILAGIVTFVGLSMMRPLFTSEARILIQNDESAFTRPESDQGRDQQVVALDEQAVQSQVQVLTSRDLAVEVVKALDLTNNPKFAKDAGVSLLRRFLNRMGLGRGSPKSEEEKATTAFAEHLSVFQLTKSSVIAVEYTSGDSPLAAEAANKLADAYINWQRDAKLEQTKDATTWLSTQNEVLRAKVAESEAAAEQFRSSQGLFAGSNNVTLNAQQLSELNSQVILANAQKSEAEARARLIKQMLADNGDINATPEVLKSELIGRLIDQRVQVQRQLAELSATLMPSHPRIKQLTSELADVRSQIRDEAAKIVKGLENEAAVASAREASLRNNLNDLKTQTSGQSEAEIKLRALEREAKANRDLLESYLARYRDASARHDMGAVPAQAAIVSRAHASVLPSFPKIGPTTLLVTAVTALLALAYVLASEMIGAPAVPREPLRAIEARLKARREPPARPAAASPQFAETDPSAGELSAAAGILDRLRRGLSLGAGEPPAVEPQPAVGLLDRLRRVLPTGDGKAGESTETAAGSTPDAARMPPRPNDLRHYLNQRIAAATSEPASDSVRNGAAFAPKGSTSKVGPVLKSLDALLNHILASAKGRGVPRALLVAGVSAKVDATPEAIQIARALVARREQVVLVDLTRGASAVSGALGLPRAPGFTDLAAGHVGFDDVVRIDADTPLQVIAAGNPKVKAKGDEAESFTRVFEALTQVYDRVVFHADREAVRTLARGLKFELPVVVAVLPPGAGAKSLTQDLSDFSALGCPVLVYEQNGKEPRSGLLARAAAS